MRTALVALMLVGCGRLGFGDDTGAPVDAPMIDALDPGVVEVSIRGSAACVRTGDGRVACWGSNARGQLGDGTVAATGQPAIVPVQNVTSIVTGEFGAFAIDRDGVLWGWGGNDAGQLGVGNKVGPQVTPIRIPVPEPVVSAAAGQFHTCAITAASGELYCWGGNQCGGLGTQDTTERTSPTKVLGLANLRSVAIHDYQTCVVDATGATACFGGILIAGCVGQQLVPTPPVGLPAMRTVQGGCHMSMCGADTTGSAWCWGENISGNLGDGSATRHLDPLPVATITNITQVGTGFDVSCGVTTDRAYCWGDNLAGQLGIGTPSVMQAVTPVALPFFDQMPVDQIEVGCSTSCVRSGHDIYCWGENVSHIVDDTGNDAFAPRRILGLPF